MPTVVIAAGGTAGHVVPALAVADELRADGADVIFAGGERAEAEASLRELEGTAMLWLSIRRTWIAHGGQGVQAAVAEYGRTCAAAEAKPG